MTDFQVIDIDGKQMALLPLNELERMIDEIEDLSDIEAASRAQARIDGGEEIIPGAIIDQLMKGENSLRVWRTYRNFTQKALSVSAGIEQSRISEIESGRGYGKPTHWRAFARALSVDIDLLLPWE